MREDLSLDFDIKGLVLAAVLQTFWMGTDRDRNRCF